MSTFPRTDHTTTEAFEHRRQLLPDRDKYIGIIERALTELLGLSVIGGGNVLGDYADSNDDLMLDEIRSRIPSSLNQHNRELLFRAIEILNEVNVTQHAN